MVPCHVLSLLTALAVKHSPWAHFGSSAPFLGAAWEASLHPFPSADDYKSELREQLPLIAGSAAAGVVFIVSLVAISIVCSRWGCERGLGWEGMVGNVLGLVTTAQGEALMCGLLRGEWIGAEMLMEVSALSS